MNVFILCIFAWIHYCSLSNMNTAWSLTLNKSGLPYRKHFPISLFQKADYLNKPEVDFRHLKPSIN